MDIFEYNEVRWPTRALQQDEEEEAVGTAQDNLQVPRVEWQPSKQAVQPQLLVIAMSPASCALLEACLAKAMVAGTVHAPGNTTDADDSSSRSSSTGARQQAVSAPLYVTNGANGQVLVCCCAKAVPPERAPAWARGVMQQLQPKRLLLVGTMQAEQYRGEADASQEFLAFLLQSSAAREAAAVEGGTPAVPYLPTGSVVAGLPAALLTQAELQETPADLIVVVDMVPALVPETLHDLSNMMGSVLRHALPADSAGCSWLDQLQQESVLHHARNMLHQTSCRPTAVYS